MSIKFIPPSNKPRIRTYIGEAKLVYNGEEAKSERISVPSDICRVVYDWKFHYHPAITRGEKVSISIDFYQKAQHDFILPDDYQEPVVKEEPTIGKNK